MRAVLAIEPSTKGKIRMKQITKLAMIGLVFGMAAAASQAQTQTVQTVSFNLTGVKDNGGNGTSSGRISNREILQALGGTNSFSSRAKLVAITPDGGSTGIFVRDVVDRQNVDTDVSGNFSNSTTLALNSSRGNQQVSIQTFSFNSDTLSFNVQGYTTGNTKNNSETSSVNGTGTINGDSAVLKGTITLGPTKSE